ncbi:MAG: YegP family protein [Gammaproteobacteria bacterium]
MSAKIRLLNLSSGEFRFELIASNRAVVATSAPFAGRDAAMQAIQALTSNALTCRFDINAYDKHYFELYSGDGSKIMRSLDFTSEQAALDAWQLVQQTAKIARLVDRAGPDQQSQ